jgi:uncharacterized repeat protein (TIGR03803 family)
MTKVRTQRLLPIMALVFTLLISIRSVQAQTFSVLYSFTDGADGGIPTTGVILDSAGNLYGTTSEGGLGRFDCPFGCGTVFKLDTAGNETVLHSFGETRTDGQTPFYGYLFRDSAGNLYGTTYAGGADGNGTIFRVSPTGKETVVSFSGGANGGFPYAGLIPDAAGNAYGTTYGRGTGCLPYGCGTVFKVNRAGKVTVLHNFTNVPDGAYPYAGLARDSAGNLYGTTLEGGANGQGAVFKVSSTGQETVLYSFCSQPNCADGAYPYAGLARDSAGNLYGTTLEDGANGQGTVFELNPTTGQETVLYSFTGGADGGLPWAGVVRDSAGNLYGTTVLGGTYQEGTVFEMNTTGQETVLYSFSGAEDGCEPFAGLTLDSLGNLYGASSYCGTGGSVFKISFDHSAEERAQQHSDR